jgi:hypothetical protein
MYSRRDIAAMCFSAGLLTGLLIAFAACAPNPDEANQHITTGAQ